MPKNIPAPAVVFNDDNEIIVRLDECERCLKACTTKGCAGHAAAVRRIADLRAALANHLLLS